MPSYRIERELGGIVAGVDEGAARSPGRSRPLP
jgi:hypothetical protein